MKMVVIYKTSYFNRAENFPYVSVPWTETQAYFAGSSAPKKN